MHFASIALQGLLLVPILAGGAYAVIRLGAVALFALRGRWRAPGDSSGSWAPPVTLLKPVYGLEKGLAECLRSACVQDYPEYQVLFSVQRPDEPALPLLRELEAEFGSERVSIAVAKGEPLANGKVFNVANAMS